MGTESTAVYNSAKVNLWLSERNPSEGGHEVGHRHLLFESLPQDEMVYLIDSALKQNMYVLLEPVESGGTYG